MHPFKGYGCISMVFCRVTDTFPLNCCSRGLNMTSTISKLTINNPFKQFLLLPNKQNHSLMQIIKRDIQYKTSCKPSFTKQLQ